MLYFMQANVAIQILVAFALLGFAAVDAVSRRH